MPIKSMVSLQRTYVELPSFHVFSCLFARDDNHEFRNLTTNDPFIQLRHNFLDVRFHLVVGGDCRSCQSSSQWRITKNVPSILRPYFLTLESHQLVFFVIVWRDRSNTHAVKSSAGYTPLWKLCTYISQKVQNYGFLKTYRIVLIEYSNYRELVGIWGHRWSGAYAYEFCN